MGPKPDLLREGHLHEIQKAIHQEVNIFKTRETLLGLFKVQYNTTSIYLVHAFLSQFLNTEK